MFLATVTLSLSVIPHLPPVLLTALAFKMHFNTSTSGDGHYDISGAVEGQPETDFLCMKKGASARSYYDYHKTNHDVSYSDGTIEQKRMFWAYLLTYGNTAKIHKEFPDDSITQAFGRPYKGNTKYAKEVAWSHGRSNGGSALIEKMANDGFMQLEHVPDGCKTPDDIFNTVSAYGTPETAISINALKAGPGQMSSEKLYHLAGLKDFEAFKKYCTITAPEVVVQESGEEKRYKVNLVYEDEVFLIKMMDAATGQAALCGG